MSEEHILKTRRNLSPLKPSVHSHLQEPPRPRLCVNSVVLQHQRIPHHYLRAVVVYLKKKKYFCGDGLAMAARFRRHPNGGPTQE